MKKITLFGLMGLVFAGSVLAKPVKVEKSDLFTALETCSRSDFKKTLKCNIGSINTLNEQGKTVLDLAIQANKKSIARDIAGYGGKVTTEVNALILKGIYKARAFNFLISGIFCGGILWIGTVTSLFHASDIMILNK